MAWVEPAVSIEYFLSYSVVEDCIMIGMNILKIIIIYRVLKRSKKKNEDMVNVYKSYKKSMGRNVLYELIGVAPVYTAVSGYVLGRHFLKGYYNPYQKMYELGLYTLFFVFLILGAIFHIIRHPDKKSQKSRFQMMVIYCEIVDNYYYTLIGFLAGLGYTQVFLMITSLYYVGYMITLIRNYRIKKEFVEICIRKLIELTVHCGFGFLYVAGNLMDDSSKAEEHSEVVSEIIIYGFLVGCLF